jgi:hypothetical protein
VTGKSMVLYDWRAARRATENPRQLEAVDRALTATGLAAEIRDWLRRAQ